MDNPFKDFCYKKKQKRKKAEKENQTKNVVVLMM
jgi:hypothetical protein